jgi:quercetin 2,3-dioxygenase
MLLRKANERGKTKTDWLDSAHSFSFADYHDPKWNRFQNLRVINEDVVAPGTGFATHGHQDMEILTFVLEGALEHKDSMNNHEIIYPYQLQKMSAGTGILHSEFNHYKDKKTHLFQIWIMPNKKGITPSYQTLELKDLKNADKGVLVAGPEKQENVIHLQQNTYVYYFKTDGEVELPKQTLWVQMLKGEIASKNFTLAAGDAIGIDKNENNGITVKGSGEFLVFLFPES